MEKPIKIDDLGGPTPIFGNIHIYIYLYICNTVKSLWKRAPETIRKNKNTDNPIPPHIKANGGPTGPNSLDMCWIPKAMEKKKKKIAEFLGPKSHGWSTGAPPNVPVPLASKIRPC